MMNSNVIPTNHSSAVVISYEHTSSHLSSLGMEMCPLAFAIPHLNLNPPPGAPGIGNPPHRGPQGFQKIKPSFQCYRMDNLRPLRRGNIMNWKIIMDSSNFKPINHHFCHFLKKKKSIIHQIV